MKETEIIARAMIEKKAERVCSMDLTGIGTSICDHFVICDAQSTTQVAAVADFVEEQMWRQAGRHVNRSQGRENGFWVILDYGDIVVHLFQTPYRQFYRLEELWADAPTTHFE